MEGVTEVRRKKRSRVEIEDDMSDNEVRSSVEGKLEDKRAKITLVMHARNKYQTPPDFASLALRDTVLRPL